MKIHEYQGKEVLARYGVAVPRGHVAFTVDEAVAAAEKLGGSVWVVKAQIPEVLPEHIIGDGYIGTAFEKLFGNAWMVGDVRVAH